ncbi:MAG: PKHD-type hydroxylase [Gammaproteobacteria bacterium]|jgi:PKHD-type hydroxylase
MAYDTMTYGCCKKVPANVIIEVPTFMSPPEVGFLVQLFETLPTRSGAASAGEALTSSKRNEELELGEHLAQVRDVVLGACSRMQGISMVVLPRLVTAPILSRYEVGMAYGSHSDAAFGQEGAEIYRTDFSCTVFLDDATAYRGGELSIETDVGVKDYKLPAGGAVFYPTLYDHQVRPVTHGVRRACVFWVESMIRDPQKRRIMLDVAQVAEWIGAREPMDSDARRAIIRARENLMRLWIEK